MNRTTEEMIALLQKQQRDLVFDHFTLTDAWTLGNILRDLCMEKQGDSLVRITVYDMPVFACTVGLPTANNAAWVNRKHQTVMHFAQSSLLVAQTMERDGKTLEMQGLSAENFALAGGGFPIRLRDGGVIGSVIVSGYPQRLDHIEECANHPLSEAELAMLRSEAELVKDEVIFGK